MSIHVFFYDRAPHTAFINKFLPDYSLGKLRLAESNFLQIMIAILPFLASVRLLARPAPTTEEAMLCEICTEASNVLPDDVVVIADMLRYPISTDYIQHLLAKAFICPDIPLRIVGSGATSCPAWFVCSGKFLTHGNAKEIASVHGESNFLDLSNLEDTMRLFSGNLLTRDFNNLSVSLSGYFVKTSSNMAKMKAEYSFLRESVAPLRQFYPQVGEYVESVNIASYEIEIIPTLDVAKSLLNGNFHDEAVCKRFFKKVEHYLISCPKKAVTVEQYRQCAHNIFIHKSRLRMEMTLALPCLSKMNAVAQLGDWPDYKTFATTFLHYLEEDIANDTAVTLVSSHGDLFFGNMLFDIHTGVLKLIDPRGFHESDAYSTYLPALYDLAKLSHSINGLYDSIIYRLTDINFDHSGRPVLHAREKLPGMEILQQCFRQLLGQIGMNESRLRLYEGSLFLSMLPLHAEDWPRMAHLFIRAMELFSRSTKE